MCKYQTVEQSLESAPDNNVVRDSLVTAFSKINNPLYKKILCSISGGADSDIVLDIIWKCDKDNKVDYVWFNTGMEYMATKKHLKYLEEKYGVDIKECKAIKSIPTSCKEFGQPFLSKKVSDMIDKLQSYGFQFEDDTPESLMKKYCEWNEKRQDYVGCKSAILWWCNKNKLSQFNISYNKFLKEFLIANPPSFKISAKCCDFAKKKPSHDILKDGGYDLNITGVRKYEGGIRSTVYKSCFDKGVDGYDYYRPVFLYTNKDKQDYENFYGIVHSECYTKWGFKRTGCCCCPYGRELKTELEVVKQYEPNLYKAACHIFKDAYEYTTQYWKFRKDTEDALWEKERAHLLATGQYSSSLYKN